MFFKVYYVLNVIFICKRKQYALGKYVKRIHLIDNKVCVSFKKYTFRGVPLLDQTEEFHEL